MADFLTFSRRLATTSRQSLRYQPLSRPSTRAFASSSLCRAETGKPNFVSDKGTQEGPNTTGNETGGSRDHALDKGADKDPNIQSYESNQGRAYVPPHHTQRASSQPASRVNTAFLGLRTGAEYWESRFGVPIKDDDADVTYASRSRTQDTGGSTTREKDERNSTERAKKDHPEAPDVVIGMQDERGGKGH